MDTSGTFSSKSQDVLAVSGRQKAHSIAIKKNPSTDIIEKGDPMVPGRTAIHPNTKMCIEYGL